MTVNSFSEQEAALRVRDLMVDIIRSEIDLQRPKPTYAKVVTIDSTNRLATVLFPGDTVPTTVSMGSIYPSAVDQIVRIEGPSGDRYIADVMGASTSGGGSSAVRTTTSYTTGVLSAGGIENGTIVLAKSFRIVAVSFSGPSRLRVYGSVAERATDQLRGWGTNPPAGLALILDYLVVATGAYNLSPEADGSSTESTPTTSIPIAITATVAGAVTVGITWIGTE